MSSDNADDAVEAELMERLAAVSAEELRVRDRAKDLFAERNRLIGELRRRGVADAEMARRLGISAPRLNVIHRNNQKRRAG